MAENLTARDLMRTSFLRLGVSHTLREAMGVLLDPRAQGELPCALFIIHPDGSFAGAVTTRYLLQSIAPDWMGDPEQLQGDDLEGRLRQALSENLHAPVTDAMVPDIPAAAPDDRIGPLIEMMRDKRVDCLPVIEDHGVVGVLYLADLFNAAANLALSASASNS